MTGVNSRAKALLVGFTFVSLHGGCGAPPNPARPPASPATAGEDARPSSASPSSAESRSTQPTTTAMRAAAHPDAGVPSTRPVVLWAENRTCYIGAELKDHPKLGVSTRGSDPIWLSPGLTIVRVVPDSPASRADLRPGDLIVGFNGVSTKTHDEQWFLARPSDFQPGDAISLQIRRGVKEFPAKLKPGRRPTSMP